MNWYIYNAYCMCIFILEYKHEDIVMHMLLLHITCSKACEKKNFEILIYVDNSIYVIL